MLFSVIRDDGVSRLGGEMHYGYYESPQHYYRTYDQLSNFYKRSWHKDQPAYVAVLCEASGMVPMLSRAVGDFRVEVLSSSGFDSLTAKRDLYRDAVRRYEAFDQNTVLLHLGDHDPSGVSFHESLSEDLVAFSEGEGHEDLVEVRRVALTPAQIQRFGIDTKPDEVKPSDSRSSSFIARGLEPAAQLEAIPPDTLSAVIRQAVEHTLDLDTLAESQAREHAEYLEVQEKLDTVNAVLRDAFRL